jgi:hypothetical protein
MWDRRERLLIELVCEVKAKQGQRGGYEEKWDGDVSLRL